MIVREGYGVIGCDEFDTTLDRIEVALDLARNKGATGDPRYLSAKKFYDANTGFFASGNILLGETCRNRVNEATRLLVDLNAAIKAVGGVGVSVPSPEITPGIPGLPDPGKAVADFKWILASVAAIGALYVFGPTLKAALGLRASRSAS